MHTAVAITNLDNRRGTLTAGGGRLSESYESYENYENYESVSAPLNYATVVSLQKHADPRAISWRKPHIILTVPTIPIIPIMRPPALPCIPPMQSKILITAAAR